MVFMKQEEDEREKEQEQEENGNTAACTLWSRVQNASTMLGLSFIIALILGVGVSSLLRRGDFFKEEASDVSASVLDPQKLFRWLLVPYLILETVDTACSAKAQASKIPHFFAASVNVFVALVVEVANFNSELDIYWSGVALFAVMVGNAGVKIIIQYTWNDALCQTCCAQETLIMLVYALFILPNYFSSCNVTTKILLCTILHPVVICLHGAGSRNRKIKTIPVHQNASSYSASCTGFNFFMHLSHRLMLLHVGSHQTTIVTIVVASIGSALNKTLGPILDRFVDQCTYRKNGTESTDADKKFVYICDANEGAIAEQIGIIASTIMYVMSQPQALAINFGYSPSGSITMVALFVQLLLQLCAFLFANGFVDWVLYEQHIDMHEYIPRIHSHKLLLLWLVRASSSAMIIAYAFARHPSFAYCSSRRVCKCLHLTSLDEYYGSSCTGEVLAFNGTLYVDDGLFEGIETSFLVSCILTVFALSTVIAASVVLARSRRRTKVMFDLSREKEAIANKIDKRVEEIIKEEMKKRQTDEQFKLLNPYKMPRSHIHLHDKLGEGAFGEVWTATCRGKKVAAKRIMGDCLNKHTANAFRNECNVMAQLQKNGMAHKNIIHMLFVCWENELLLVLELCEIGALDEMLLSFAAKDHEERPSLLWTDPDNGQLPGVLAKLSHAIARGMDFMHSLAPKIIHRDLKPGNILLQGSREMHPIDWTPKIADMGEARQLREGDNLSMVGTPFYCCPEIVMCEEYDEKADVYSYGVMLFDLATYKQGGVGNALWGKARFSQVGVVKGRRPSIPQSVPLWVHSIITSCWSGRADERPPFSAIKVIFEDQWNSLKSIKGALNITKKEESERVQFSDNKALSVTKNARRKGGIVFRTPLFSRRRVRSRASTVRDPLIALAGTIPIQTNGIKRILLLATLFGYSVILSLFIIIFVAAWTASAKLVAFQDATENGGHASERFRMLNVSNDFGNFLLIWYVMYGIATTANVGKSDTKLYPAGGIKFAAVPMTLTCILPFVMSLLYSALAEYDTRYSLFDVIGFVFVYILLFIVLDITCRNYWKKARARNDTVSKESHIKTKTQEIKSTAINIITRLSIIIMNASFLFGYVFYILPIYFSSSIGIRMAICLVIHPIAVECNQLLGRLDAAAKVHRYGVEEAKGRVRDKFALNYLGKVFFSISRRVMLLSLGDFTATMITIVFTSIEEAILRSFLVEIDTFFHKCIGKTQLKGRDLEVQRYVWAIDINQSSIAEYVSIIVSTFVFILLKPHSFAINLGYIPGEKVLAGLQFTQLVIELILEGVVDIAAIWAETEHSIPVESFFSSTHSILYWVVHLSLTILSLFLVLYSLARYPNAMTCNSNWICDCYDQPQYVGWYDQMCSFATNETDVANLTYVNSTFSQEMIFDDVDTGLIAGAVIALISFIAFVYLCFSYFRYRKRGAKIKRQRTFILNIRSRFDHEVQKLVENVMAISRKDECADSANVLDAYKVPREHIIMTERIKGSERSEVWLGKCRGAIVAVKRIYLKSKSDTSSVKAFKEECSVMATLQSNGVSHPNLVQLLFCCWEEDLLLVLEYHALGSFRDVVSTARQNPLCFGEKLTWRKDTGDGVGILSKLAADACDGMIFMGERKLLHLDLKPENILVDAQYNDRPSKWRAKVADFGASRSGGGNGIETTLAGTLMFASPEMLSGEQVSVKSDIYSFAMLLLDVAASLELDGLIGQWDGNFATNRVFWLERPRLLPSMVSGNLIWLGDLIYDCWNDDIAARPQNFEEVKKRILDANAAPA